MIWKTIQNIIIGIAVGNFFALTQLINYEI